MNRWVAVLAALLLAGCAGSFEEARSVGQKHRTLGEAAAPAVPSDYCQSLDRGHIGWAGIELGAASLAGASGLGQIPAKTDTVRAWLAAGTVTMAATAAVAGGFANGAANSWTRACAAP